MLKAMGTAPGVHLRLGHLEVVSARCVLLDGTDDQCDQVIYAALHGLIRWTAPRRSSRSQHLLVRRFVLQSELLHVDPCIVDVTGRPLDFCVGRERLQDGQAAEGLQESL